MAHDQVRNVGSVAGNLVMAHGHGDFVSDVAAILMTAKAKIKVGSAYNNGQERILSLEEFYKISLDGLVILDIVIPVLGKNARVSTYKIALRRVNAHALMNAGFNMEVDTVKGTYCADRTRFISMCCW